MWKRYHVRKRTWNSGILEPRDLYKTKSRETNDLSKWKDASSLSVSFCIVVYIFFCCFSVFEPSQLIGLFLFWFKKILLDFVWSVGNILTGKFYRYLKVLSVLFLVVSFVRSFWQFRSKEYLYRVYIERKKEIFSPKKHRQKRGRWKRLFNKELYVQFGK